MFWVLGRFLEYWIQIRILFRSYTLIIAVKSCQIRQDVDVYGLRTYTFGTLSIFWWTCNKRAGVTYCDGWMHGQLEPVYLEDVLEQGEPIVKDFERLPETTTV
jgi:hypothetical protein